MSLSVSTATSKTNDKLYCAGKAKTPVFAKNCSDEGTLSDFLTLYHRDFFKLKTYEKEKH